MNKIERGVFGLLGLLSTTMGMWTITMILED